jgi:hypothetical protein
MLASLSQVEQSLFFPERYDKNQKLVETGSPWSSPTPWICAMGATPRWKGWIGRNLRSFCSSRGRANRRASFVQRVEPQVFGQAELKLEAIPWIRAGATLGNTPAQQWLRQHGLF